MSAYTQFAYPYFRKGQVLKNTDLNYMVDYLDQHNRFTRVLVIGTGIFYGLEVNLEIESTDNSIATLIVTQGFGLSSDGYIIQLKKNVASEPVAYTHFRKLIVSENDFRCRKSADNNGPEPETWDVYELLEKANEKSEEEDVFPLIDLVNEVRENTTFCLVFWVSREEKDRPFCIDICDESGADLNFTIKPILVRKEDLSDNNETEGRGQGSVSFNDPPVVRLRPFGYKEGVTIQDPMGGEPLESAVVNPALISDHAGYLQNYIDIINDTVE